MTVEVFFGILSMVGLVAVAAEYHWSRTRALDWHGASNTLANLNLGVGNAVLSGLVGVFVSWGYVSAGAFAVTDLTGTHPVLRLGGGFLLAELCQYWMHRAGHSWNFFSWGHLTHHSSSRLNLSTGMRVSWLFRVYSWVFFLPLALLGYSLGEFIGFLLVMNVYNLFMHTRVPIHYGPLEGILVSPRAHNLHHTDRLELAGNYGASLLIFDRLFGTYRTLEEPDASPTFGLAHDVDEAGPLRLNFHHLQDLWVSAGARASQWFALLLSRAAPLRVSVRRPLGDAVPGRAWLGAAGLAGLAVGGVALGARFGLAGQVVMTAVGLGLTILYGEWLTRAAQPQ